MHRFKTENTRNLLTVEYLRAVLCVGIIMFHTSLPYAQMLWAGVQAFFVLSAFFMVLKLGTPNRPIAIGPLFRRRIARLYLPYLAVVALAVLYALLRRTAPLSIACDTALHGLGLQSFEWLFTGYSSPLQPMTAHTWTLGIEIWLYLVFLFLLKAVNRSQTAALKRVLILIAAGTVVYRCAAIGLGLNKNWVSLLPFAHLDAYALGGLAAIAYRENRERMRFLAARNILIGGALILASIFTTSQLHQVSFGSAYALYRTSDGYLHHIFTGQIYLYLAIFWTGLLFAMIAISDRWKVRDVRFLSNMGQDSYTLYLFHWPVCVVCKFFFDSVWVVFGLTVILTWTANLCYSFLEKLLKTRWETFHAAGRH